MAPTSTLRPLFQVHYMSWWLRGENTHRPGVARAGDVAMRWYENNKDRPTVPAIPLPQVVQPRGPTVSKDGSNRAKSEVKSTAHEFVVTDTMVTFVVGSLDRTGLGKEEVLGHADSGETDCK